MVLNCSHGSGVTKVSHGSQSVLVAIVVGVNCSIFWQIVLTYKFSIIIDASNE